MTKIIDFSKYSSIKIGPKVEVIVIDEVVLLPDGIFLVGGANNILVSNDPPPLVMLGKSFDYIKKEDNRLIIGGSTKSGRIFSYCKKHNINGFEYLSKLPGTLGGLVKMNAGMKDDEIFDNLISIKTYKGYIDKKDISYGYRYTDIKDTIYEAVFEIKHGFSEEKLAKFTAMRKNQPSLPSAGSVFKNPPNDYAGRLIDAVGLKGYKKGRVSFSDIHANFLVNEGGATFEDAIFLIGEAKKRVFEEFGIKLEKEIIVV